jgi:hypothetical protein
VQQNDPSSIHNISCDLIEEGTCDWVFRLPEWIQWISLQSRCLWIHGIPGSGKTVLAARLIDQTYQLCSERLHVRHVSVYYYCHHSHNKDESVPFLRWILSQLCRNAEKIPLRLQNIYKTGCEPTQYEMLICLEEAVEWFDAVFIIVDALDESNPRAALLTLIRTLMTDVRFCKIQLLATSREYVDIKQAMLTISQPISMAHPSVEADIATSVKRTMQSTPRFKAWPPDVWEEVIAVLSHDANGMFRWAMCQLDILKHAGSMEEVTEALHNLPPTLDDTYNRIFATTARDDWPLLRHALQMLSFHDWLYGNWIHYGLSPALILSTYAARSGHKNHFYTVETLEEICGCLVTFSVNKKGQCFAMFAHYTVREFLESDRVRSGPAAYFALREANQEIVDFVFRHSLAVGLEIPLPDWTQYDRAIGSSRIYARPQCHIDGYCIFSASAILYDHEWRIAADDSLSELAFRFLNPLGFNFKSRCNAMRRLLEGDSVMFRDAVGRGQRFWDIRWSQSPASPEVGTLTLLLWSSFFNLAVKFQSRVQAQVLSDTQLSLDFTISEQAEVEETYVFEGTIIELFTKYSSLLCSGSQAVDLLRNLLRWHGIVEGDRSG